MRRRQEDIAALALHFMKPQADHLAKRIEGISPEALTLLQSYSWPGNVRELEQTIERAVTVCKGGVIQAKDLALGSDVEAGEPAANGQLSG